MNVVTCSFTAMTNIKIAAVKKGCFSFFLHYIILKLFDTKTEHVTLNSYFTLKTELNSVDRGDWKTPV